MHICSDSSDPDGHFVFKIYSDPASLERDSKAAWFLNYIREVGPLLAEPPRVLRGTLVWRKRSDRDND
jgi:quinol monooxygenase YgiN